MPGGQWTGENPFAALGALLFSGQAHDSPPATAQSAGGQPDPGCDADALLFLRAVQAMPGKAQAQTAAPFTLSGLCQLPDIRTEVKKTQKSKPEPAEPMARDDDLFLRAAAGASPLAPGGRAVSRAPAGGEPPALGQPTLEDFMAGRLEFAIANYDEYLEGHVVGLDESAMNRLRAGSYSPEAHVDLHGLNSLQAFESLRAFFRSAWFKGLRCVLVVPGRGRNSPFGQSVLRAKLQHWLTQEPFKRLVLAFCTAQPHDGGPGSVYVLLRRNPKKGRIFWERMPADADLY